MTPDISILIPHMRQPHTDRALNVCLSVLLRATRTTRYELVVQSHENLDCYAAWTGMAAAAQAPVLALWTNDQYPALGWDVRALEVFEPNVLITIPNCESGYSPSHHANAVADFGRTPESFDVRAFETWSRQHVPNDVLIWQFPWVIDRERFLDLGGFPVFPLRSPDWEVTDKHFFDRWMSTGGRTTRAQTWVYHLMRWTYSGAER